jgi:hypothetical protein
MNTAALAPEALLWHYTDFKGLAGILGGNIWASSLAYLNDTEEFRHGAQLALEVVQNQLATSLSGGEYAPYASTIHQELLRFFSNQQPKDIFITSFSERDDDLSQWRAYGGNRGPMFSVGFNPTALEQKANEHSFELDEVIYRRQNILAHLNIAFKPVITDISASLGIPSGIPQQISRHVARIAQELFAVVPLCKNPKFSDEKEWRLIRRQPALTKLPRLPTHFRQSGSLIVPYLEMPLHIAMTEFEVIDTGRDIESPVAAITIGPSPHPEQLEAAVEEMVWRTGLTLVKVQMSAVPYRNW